MVEKIGPKIGKNLKCFEKILKNRFLANLPANFLQLKVQNYQVRTINVFIVSWRDITSYIVPNYY